MLKLWDLYRGGISGALGALAWEASTSLLGFLDGPWTIGLTLLRVSGLGV